MRPEDSERETVHRLARAFGGGRLVREPDQIELWNGRLAELSSRLGRQSSGRSNQRIHSVSAPRQIFNTERTHPDEE